jgi:hypothetical protein
MLGLLGEAEHRGMSVVREQSVPIRSKGKTLVERLVDPVKRVSL